MVEGKVNAATKFLSENNESSVLPANSEVINELKTKHPCPATIQKETLLHGPISRTENSYFDNTNEELIKVSAIRTKGAARPSSLDAEQYKNILVKNKYKNEGKELCEQIVLLAKKSATSIIDLSTIEALVICNQIPLNKNP